MHNLLIALFVLGQAPSDVARRHADIEEAIQQMETEKEWMEWFYLQRALPLGYIPAEAVNRARAEAEALKRGAKTPSGVWEPVGPINIGGRVTAIAVNPHNTNEIYIGTADGGVFKSEDGGATWVPVFDSMPSLSIGAIAIDPVDTAIYVGTGEVNSSGDSFNGTGLYVSHDHGITWEHLGLDSTAHIARIVFDPTDHNTIYVAAMGHLYTTDTTRGVYKSTDGGQTWQKVLFVDDTTGCIDLVINPQNPNILYAAMWSRIRTPENRRVSGSGSGIYRSTDGGATWEYLTIGLPTSNVGRIGITISQTDPNVLYAIFSDHPGYFTGVYKTTYGGDTWSRTIDGNLSDIFSSYGWYFGQIRVDPTNPQVVYAMGLHIYKTTDGGNSWYQLTGWDVHVDHHDLWISPSNPDHLIDGNDGGVYISTNGGTSWSHVESLPITQFYDVAIDPNHPVRYYGGTQDNGTIRTMTGSVDDWEEILGGDGFLPAIDPRNSNNIFAEWQYGHLEKSTNGGWGFDYCLYGVNENDRRNWDTPYALTPSNPDIMYYGTYRVYKSTDFAGYWTPVSGDLTNGPGNGNLRYGTLTVIKVSPANPNYVYVGTDDGNVWISSDAGNSWQHVSDSLPNRYVTDIAAHPTDPMTFYVTFSGYSLDENTPYIFVTHDAGSTWTDVTDNLPHAPVNAVEVDPSHPNLVYVGTDMGVYYSTEGGGNWQPLGTGLPNSVVMDLALDDGSRTLIAGTHGRSMFRFDLRTLDIAEDEHGGTEANGFNLIAIAESKTIRISLQVPRKEHVTVQLFSPVGRFISTVFDGTLDEGVHSFDYNARRLPGGAYFIRVKIGERSFTRKVLVF